MAQFKGHNTTRVATLGVALILAAIVVTYVVSSSGFGQGGYEMSGVFAGSGGLAKGDDVQVAGVVVGKVESIDADFQHGNVVVRWKVDGGIDLGPQTHADIEAANLLGGQYVKLSGPVVRPYLSSVSQTRRQIPLARTSIPYTLNQAINGSTNLATQLDTGSIDKILQEAAGISPPSQQALATMLHNLDGLTTTLNARAPEVEAIISNSQKLTSTLAAKDTELAQLLTYGQNLLKVISQRRDDLATALGNSSQVVSTLDTVISQHQSDLESILKNMHSALGALTGSSLGNLNIDLSWLGPAFNMLTLDTGNGRWMEGGLSSLGPLSPALLGPEPSFEPPNYPYPGVPTTAPSTSGGDK